MAFYGSTFIYDGIPSEEYNLRIINFDTGMQEGVSAGTSSIIEEYQIHRTKSYFYKRTHNVPLEFEFTVGSCGAHSAVDYDIINRWLLGRKNYKKLQIVQNDLSDIYWNVIFTNAVPLYNGNILNAIRYSAHCDSGFAWTLPAKFTYRSLGVKDVGTIGTIFVDGTIDEYIYPIIELTNGAFSGDIVLENTAINIGARSAAGMNTWSVLFKNLEPYEKVYVDNENKIVDGNKGFRYNDLGNNIWFRLINGFNPLNLSGSVDNLSIEYQIARKVGV